MDLSSKGWLPRSSNQPLSKPFWSWRRMHRPSRTGLSNFMCTLLNRWGGGLTLTVFNPNLLNNDNGWNPNSRLNQLLLCVFFGGPSGWLRYEISWRPVHPRKSKVCFDLGVPAYLVVLRFNQPGTWGDCSETSCTWLLYSVSNLNVSMYLFLRWWLISCFWPAH